MLSEFDLELLSKNGWTPSRLNPHSLFHANTNSIVSGIGVQIVLDSLRASNTLFGAIRQTAEEIKDGRSCPYILASTMEEVGELAKEVAIEYLDSGKTPDSDGIIGESVDAIICLVDMIATHCPNISEAELVEIANTKLAKWKNRRGQ